MRGILIGVLIGLLIGGPATFAYTHYLGEGAQLAQVQAELGTANANLAKATDDSQQLKSENDTLSTQVKQFSSRNDELKAQVEELKSNSTADANGATPAAANPMAGIMKTAMAQQYEQKLFMLKSRLHLTPDQEAAVKAAMDEESKRTEEMTSRMFSGGKFDPQALSSLQGVKTVDQTLKDILTPDQMTTYQQMQNDEKSSAVEMMANTELSQMSPLLQLSEAQKDQVYSVLYQTQANMMDPSWVMKNMPTSTDPTAMLEAQAKAKEDALAKVLTPDQLATYHQQAQSQLEMQKAMMQKMPQGMGIGTAPATTTVTPAANPAPAQ